MKVLLLTSWGTALPHVINGYAKGFKALGHEVDIYDVSEYKLDTDEDKEQFFKKVLYEYVTEYSPELVVFYGVQGMGSGPSNKGTIWEELQIPYVLLFYDNPFVYLQTISKEYLNEIVQSPLAHVVISDKEYSKELKAAKITKTINLPLATDANLFDLEKSEEELAGFACDLSFVGRIDDDPLNVTQRRNEQLTKYPVLNRIVDQIVCPDKDIRTDILMTKLDPYKDQMDWNIYAVLTRLIYEESMTKYRIAVIDELKDYSVELYGNKGWEVLASKNVKYHGALDYKKNAVNLYKASKINLNITHPQLLSTVNQRLFDVSAAGGFVLSDYRESIAGLFDGTLDSFKSRKELKEKVAYYLTAEQERKERATSAKDITLKKHLWQHRVKDLIDFIK